MNFFIINADTYRYDNLFDRADMPVRTPHLDRFAERAVELSRMYAGSFPTIPERTDLIPGRYGWPWYGWQDLARSSPNCMPKILAESDYVSQLICDCPHLFNSGFQKVFHAAVQVRGQEGDLPLLRMNREIKEVMPRAKTRKGHHFQGHTLADQHRWTNQYYEKEADAFPPRTAALAIDFLEENYRHDPFLLWLDFFDPHEPWDPPEYLVRKYDPDYDGTPMLHPNYGKASDYTPAELRNLRAHYCAEAELVVRWVGRVLEKIDDLGLWQNSVIIFTTDHGIALGEHNRTGKSNINENDDRMWPLYPEIAHIPFLIAAPDVEGGRKLDLFAQPADIFPTLLDLAGLRAEPPEPFHGQSIAPQLKGEHKKPVRDLAISGSFLRSQGGTIRPTAVTPMVYTEKWAYAPYGTEGDRELYDLEADPGADANVADAHPAVVADLHQRAVQWLRDIEAPAEAVSLLADSE